MNKGSEDLPIEYLTSSLAQQNQVILFSLKKSNS